MCGIAGIMTLNGAAPDGAVLDRLRDALAAQGVVLEDKPGGVTTWRRR